MTADQTTTPAAPDVTADPVWRRCVLDAAAFQRAYPTPAHLAELVMQVAALGFARGMRHQQLNADVRPNSPAPTQIIADVMDHAAHRPGDGRLAALHAFAHASLRARAGQHAWTETATDDTAKDGGNCGG